MLKSILQINPSYQQMFFHTIYILLAFKIHVQERSPILIISMLLFVIVVEMFIMGKLQGKKLILPISSLVIANSIYLNMEAYGDYYWPFFLALSLALVAKYCLRVRGRPVFNPSLIGVLFIAAVLPQYGSAAMYGWNNDWIYVAMVFCFGTYITSLAKTVTLSYSYIISFFFISLIISYLARLFPGTFSYFIPSDIPLLLYPLSIFCFGNILFAFHGIGDPASAPKSNRGQIIFGVSMGILDFLLRLGVVLAAPFLAYAILLLICGALRLVNESSNENSAVVIK